MPQELEASEELAVDGTGAVAEGDGRAAGRDLRVPAVALAGFCTFLDLYATQPLLPLLMRVFHASHVQVSLTVSATTLAVALAAPLIGLFADAVGRKRIIVPAILGLSVPTLLAATAPTLYALVGWRFAQGLLMPGIFAVTMAYISEEWAGLGAGRAMSGYITGNVIGGFAGRFLTGLVAERWGWREAFLALGGLNLIGGLAVWLWLPRARRFVPEKNFGASLRAMASHLRRPALLATFAVGFNVLFSLVATFTYITFYLAAPPFQLGAVALGSLFLVYLLGVIVTPLAGRWLDRAGHRRMLMAGLAASSLGALLTLSHHLGLIVAGLAVCSSGVFVCQSSASSHVGAAAGRARSAAAGLYVTFYYAGGSVGALLPGLAWAAAGWPGVVALVVAVQALTAGIALAFWHGGTHEGV
ncbi:MAG: MFS transporter [Armatimonadetes bacterium]|nr:MFS transporter [Armatimonadota bacterium]